MDVSQLYDSLNRQYHYMIHSKDEYADNLSYIACTIRDAFSNLGYSNETITDMLVEHLYGNQRRCKQLLWFCYGQYILNNLERNVPSKKTRTFQCIDCGEWYEVGIFSRACRCVPCQKEYRRISEKTRKRKKQ